MMKSKMFTVGQKVRIKENAFPDSSDECDILARGKTGIIVTDLEQAVGGGWNGCYEIELDEPINKDDINIYPIESTEIEPNETPNP